MFQKLEILDHYGVELDGKNVTLIGRSLVVGKPLMMLLAARNATVRLCHTHTRDLKEACADADIVITAIGCAKAVPGDIFPEHAVVIDVGINTDAAGNLCGDVDYEVACDRVAAITPVPGGVGSVTTSALASNLIEAAQKMADRKTTSSGEGMPDLFYVRASLQVPDRCPEAAARLPMPGFWRRHFAPWQGVSPWEKRSTRWFARISRRSLQGRRRSAGIF